MGTSLRDKAVAGGFWNAIERFGTASFLFVSNLVLARLLTPDDFGCVGMILIFVEISSAIVDGGFSSALIQRKGATQTDFSTVFYWNIILAFALYSLLYVTSPLIAAFYEIEKLNLILRVQGLVLIFNAFSMIQTTILTKELSFRYLAKRKLLAVFVGTVVGILCAFMGCGVWSLVAKTLLTSVVASIIFWIYTPWYPSLTFSFPSLRSLFKFGSFMFLSSITNKVYSNTISLVLGKGFSSSILGYFTQARKLEDIPRQVVSSIIKNVSFPVLSSINDNSVKMDVAIRKSLALLCFVCFPLSVFPMLIAKPLILFLFSEKWLPSVPYLQVLCLHSAIAGIVDYNLQILKATGRSNLLFYTGVLRKGLGILLILSGLAFGVYGVLWAFVLSHYLGFVIITYPMHRFTNYGTFKQIRLMLPYMLISFFAGVVTFILVSLFSSHLPHLFNMLLQLLVFMSAYILLSMTMQLPGYDIAKEITIKLLRK